MGQENKTNKGVKNILVSSSEFDLVQEFLKFIQGREWGEFRATVSCHKKNRRVVINMTDIKYLELSRLEK